ncbi:hypothetical protein AYL99_03462 [Fonsecaea erecta]|uniref:Zn(2)-C6 fungal-type domain-containing protein n=1 Tax=Fonsecaea erecta TaxID=1367422 RepID=A0A178ZP64_9EURO|nr:hypothetical protein AYL99_03462 [Fonsecaea erecta]OAP61261.1 hypothetical protein AYL99_03462 [Fonsecaea erecta]
MHRSSSPSSSSPTPTFPPGFRSRRSHAKSRNGCLTCKQRRKKCDERRPCCTLCETSLRTCVYASGQRSPHSDDSGTTAATTTTTTRSSLPSPVPSPPRSFISLFALQQPSRELLSRSPVPGSGGTSSVLSQAGVSTVDNGSAAAGSYNHHHLHHRVTDADLYFHFLHHTCRTAPSWQKDRLVLQVGIAKLALDNELASHSVLALAAACLCCDTIASAGADPETVRHILDRGLEHHTRALQQMRTMTSRPREADTQPLLVSALMLVPFALAFQHIQHWVLCARNASTTTTTTTAPDLLTPRDMILLLRGIRTTIVALNSNRVESEASTSASPWDTMQSSSSTAQGTDPNEFPTMVARSHAQYPILAATFQQASWQLRCRIENARAVSPRGDENIAAVFEAYEILNDIMTSTFTDDPKSEIPFEYASHFVVSPDSLLAQAPGWLQNFILQRPRPSPTEPLARSFLAFFSSAPQTYVDQLLPLLDPVAELEDEDERELTPAEVLALDVYAHWLVLMLVLEKEAWWVGDFPFVALQGLLARYGHGLGGAGGSFYQHHHHQRQHQQHQNQDQNQQWWPAGMLDVAAGLRQWK